MTGSDVRQIKELFQQAIELSAPERRPFLERACGDDHALRARVQALLVAHDEPDFLQEPATAATTRERPGDWIGRYRLQEQIGEGGFGVVWMAEQQDPVRRQVAVKIIKHGLDSRQVVARFAAERQALAMMHHPNIAMVLDAGETPAGRPFFAMELVRGTPITRFADEQQLDATQRLHLFVDVCHAVQHAHQKGVIHRDLKPSNVLVTQNDGKPVPKIIDFGIAKATQRPLTEKTLFTEFRQMVGTPEYMAPEQAEMSGLDLDTRADVYSLGVLLYELLTGSSPFADLRERSMLELLRVICDEEPPKPSTRVSKSASGTAAAESRSTTPRLLCRLLRGDLDWIVMKALEKDRSHRYASASAFAEDVLRHLHHEPVQAGPPGAAYRLRKYVRRHRVGVIASAFAGLALCAGLGAALWGLELASGERDAARAAERQAVAQRDRADREKARAEAGEAQARKEVNRANTVLAMVERMLESADPHANKGHDYKVRQLLEDFDRGLGTQLASEPEVEASVRRLIGSAWLGLGLPDRAEPQLQRARTLRQQVFGDRHLLVVESLRDEARLQHDRGHYAAALATLEQARPIAEELAGADSEPVASILASAADMQRHLGRLDAADLAARGALAVRLRRPGHGHRDMTASLHLLAGVLQDQGKLVEAEAMFRDCVRRQREAAGDDDADLAVILGNLAGVLQAQRKFEEAAALLRQTADTAKARYGDEHPAVARALGNLGLALCEQGQLVEAEVTVRQSLGLYEKLDSKEHAEATAVRNTLGLVLLGAGRPDEAEAELRQTLALQQRMFGEDHPRIATTLGNLGRVLLAMGQPGQAEALHRQALAMQRRLLPPGHRDLATRLVCLGEALSAQGNFAAAAEQFRAALPICLQVFGEEHYETGLIRNNLGSAANALGQFAEAESELRAAVAIWSKVRGPRHLDVAIATFNLATCVQDQQRYAEAAALHAEVLAIRREHRADDPLIATGLLCLGNLHRIQDRLAEAEQCYREALALQQRVLPEGHPEVAISLDNLAGVALAQGRRAEAIALTEQELAVLRRHVPADHPELAEPLFLLGNLQLLEQRFADAETALRACLPIFEAVAPAGWQRWTTVSLLGVALAGKGEDDDAERLLVQGLEGLAVADVGARRAALERLVKFYTARGNQAAAARHQQTLDSMPAGQRRK